MKTVKYLLLLIIAILIAALVYLNLDYFMATVSLKFNVKNFNYTIPELPNIAYFGSCFLLGLLLAGIKVISTKLCSNKTIKEKDAAISTLIKEVGDLKKQLDVFIHDPYIKKGLADKASALEVVDISDPTQVDNKIQTDIETDVSDAPEETDSPEQDDSLNKTTSL